VGVDVSKDKLDVHVDNAKKPFSVPNTPAGRGKLIARIRGLPLARVVVESSGGYERPRCCSRCWRRTCRGLT